MLIAWWSQDNISLGKDLIILEYSSQTQKWSLKLSFTDPVNFLHPWFDFVQFGVLTYSKQFKYIPSYS